MRKTTLIISLILLQAAGTMAQQGSQYAFQFMNVAVSPRVAAIGGNFLPLNDDDLLLALHNPALINASMHNHLGLSFLDYPAGITAGNVAYGRTFDKFGSFIGGIRFVHYGNFQRTDPSGNDLGTFSASDLAMTVGWARELHPGLFLGADVNLMISDYDVWSSFAVSADVAGHYNSPSKLFHASLLVRNAGRQIDRFAEEKENLPFEIAGGVSRKLTHAPLRLYLLLNTLNEWDLTYDDPLNPSFTVDPITGAVTAPGKTVDFLDKAMRHVTAGLEFMPGNIFRVRLGYDYRTRQESGVQTHMGLAGFSWGLGLKFGKYYFDFSRSRQHLAGANNYFSIRTSLGKQ